MNSNNNNMENVSVEKSKKTTKKMNIVRSGDTYKFINSAEIINEIPKGSYIYEISMFGPYLNKVEDIELPSKIYPNDKVFIEHVLKTWHSDNESMGMLLTGKKGLGKSFTANYICSILELPVIKVTRSVNKNEGLFDFLNDIKQPHIVFIDEFEKIFSNVTNTESNNLNQDAFLSFLDGSNSSNTKRLFIITSNARVNEFFLNRPSRLKYVKEYNELDIDIAKEIILSKLNNKDFMEDLISNLDTTTANIDIVIKIIDEINLHNKPFSEFKHFFNYKIDSVNYNINIKSLNNPHEFLQQTLFLDNISFIRFKNKTIINDYEFGEITINKKTYDVFFDSSRLNETREHEEMLSIPLKLAHYNTEKEDYEEAIPTTAIIKRQLNTYAF